MKRMSASVRRSKPDRSSASSRSATASRSACGKSRPSTAPICAISRAGPSRSSRAASDCWRVGGIVGAPPSTLRLQEEARHLFDEQRHAAAALAHPFNHLLRQRMTRGQLADHARDLSAIERSQRDDAVMRAYGPGRAKLRACGRNDQERRLTAALGQRAHEIERGRIGPVQILEGQHGRLRPSARENPGRYCRELSAPQLFRRESTAGAPRWADPRPRARAWARIRPRRGRLIGECSRDQRAPVQRARRRRRTAGGPIPRSDAAGYFAGAAMTTTPPMCEASRQAERGTPRPIATSRCRARRSRGRVGPRQNAHAPSADRVARVPPRVRRAASARAPRPACRRRSPVRCGRAPPALERL